MKKAAVVSKGIVTNICEVDDNFSFTENIIEIPKYYDATIGQHISEGFTMQTVSPEREAEIAFRMNEYVTPYSNDVLAWDDLNGPQKDVLRDYRIALLKVKKQPGYPATVVWPQPPSFVSQDVIVVPL